MPCRNLLAAAAVLVLLCGCKQLGPYHAGSLVPVATTPSEAATPSQPSLASATASLPPDALSPSPVPSLPSVTPQPSQTTPTPEPDRTWVSDLSFVDANQGWATGLFCAHSGVQCRPALWHTVDGGRIWREMATPVQLATTSLQQNSVDASHVLFATANDGWLYGPKLYVTHDGGVTWASVWMWEDVESITYADDVTWLMLLAPCPTLNWRYCERTLLNSHDLGLTWGIDPNWPGLGGVEASVLRLCSGRAWAIGDVGILTRDGGKIWQRFDMPTNCVPQGRNWQVMFGDSGGEMWLVCSGAPSAGSEGRYVYRSPDDGSSWTEVFGPSATGYASHFVATSNATAFLCGSRMPLLRTDDGGRTWRAAIAPYEGDWFCSVLYFLDARHGWFAVGDDLPYGWYGAIWRTEDGGTHWQRVGLP